MAGQHGDKGLYPLGPCLGLFRIVNPKQNRVSVLAIEAFKKGKGLRLGLKYY